MTSLSQCTASSTRVAATDTASPAATPASTRARPRAAVAAEDERGGGQERRRPRGVPARERRAERLRDRVEGRARAVGELLDGRGEQAGAGHHDEHERNDPAVAGPDRLHEGHQRGEHADRVRLPDERDRVQHVVGERGGVSLAPVRDAAIEPHEAGVGPHEEREDGEQEAAAEHDREPDGERQPGHALGVNAPAALRKPRSLGDGGSDLLAAAWPGWRRDTARLSRAAMPPMTTAFEEECEKRHR